jgi:hypothetical protein
MKWFKKSPTAVEAVKELAESTLQREIDVVPKTEISAHRQTLENINIALNVGESSSGANDTKQKSQENAKVCKNKYCCGVHQDEAADDNGDDESINNLKNSKTKFIGNLRSADNNAHAPKGSIFDETECRRPRKNVGNVKNRDYIIFFESTIDYGRLECPDSPQLNVFDDYPTLHYSRKYVQLKSKKERQYSHTFDLFTTSDKLETAEKSKIINHKLLSLIEKQIDDSKYNLLNCKIYNNEYRSAQEKYGFAWTVEDFNDDMKNTRMSDDTKAIKEFYKLSINNHVHIHFQDIPVETGENVETYSTSVMNFLTWLVLKGKEMRESRKETKTSWIKEILMSFKKSE